MGFSHWLKKQWNKFIKNPYKWLWSKIGGRPWTFITRDVWHHYEYIMQMAWFFIGIGVYHYFGWWGVLWFVLAYSFGYINGHFFWGQPYIPWQKGE